MSEFAGAVAAAAIRDAFQRLGAAAAFGLPGGPNQVLFQALRGSQTRLIVPTHELAAAFMAGSYGRIDGRPGILLTIPGPGFAFALNGLAEAWQDSAPLLHVVAAPPAEPHRRLRHQGLDQAALARPIVKAVLGVREVAQIGSVLGAAWECARSGEPGPVLVQLGADEATHPASTPAPDLEGARRIWARVHAARRPVLLLGQGCAQVAPLVRAYVERTGTPVFSTPSGRGIIPESSPWCLGYDTLRESTTALNDFLIAADLVLAIGARLAHNGTAGGALRLPPEKLVHVDANPANLNALYPGSEVATLTAEEFFALPQAAGASRTDWTLAALAPRRAQIASVHPDGPEPRYAGGAPRDFFAALRAALPDEALVVTDSGLHQALARRYFEVRAPHGLFLPTDLQSMGFGLPAAIAARLASPARPVVALIGDGGALMSGLELAVAVREQLALTVIVFNDGYLNQIRLQQLGDRGRTHGVTLPEIDFRALAQTVGAHYVAADASLGGVREYARSSGVTLMEVAVSDGAALSGAALMRRAKALAGGALGPTWGARVRAWLRR
jgi:acetolactate synthase-1/2/3 large subunit